MPSDEDQITRCKNCRERIEKINFALGPKWLHWPTPYGNYRTNEKYEHCHGLRAEPEAS